MNHGLQGRQALENESPGAGNRLRASAFFRIPCQAGRSGPYPECKNTVLPNRVGDRNTVRKENQRGIFPPSGRLPCREDSNCGFSQILSCCIFTSGRASFQTWILPPYRVSSASPVVTGCPGMQIPDLVPPGLFSPVGGQAGGTETCGQPMLPGPCSLPASVCVPIASAFSGRQKKIPHERQHFLSAVSHREF